MNKKLLIALLSSLPLVLTQAIAQTLPEGSGTAQEEPELTNPLNDSNHMIYFKCHYTGDKIPVDNFARISKKYWRITNKYFRIEEEYDPKEKLKELIVVAEPDTWVINLATKKGVYTLDKDNAVKSEIFSDDQKFKFDLEFGQEVYYFENHQAQQIKNLKDNTIVYTLENPYVKLSLITDLQKTPKKITLEPKDADSATGSYSVIYDEYKSNLKPDYNLFKVPNGVKIKTQEEKSGKPIEKPDNDPNNPAIAI